MTPAQCRAARAMIEWTQPQLAHAAGVSPSTVRDFEASKRKPIANNVAAMQTAFDKAGIIFQDDNGLKVSFPADPSDPVYSWRKEIGEWKPGKP